MITLGITRVFDKVKNRDCHVNTPAAESLEESSHLSSSPLSCRFLKVVVNGQYSEAQGIKAGIFPQFYPFSAFPGSFANIYTDDSMVYGCTSQNIDNQSLGRDLLSDRSKWGL